MCSEHTVKVSALIAGACNDNEHKKVVWSCPLDSRRGYGILEPLFPLIKIAYNGMQNQISLC